MGVYEEFQTVLDNPMSENERFLEKLLHDNQDTEYGKKLGFADIHSVAEYQQKVPVTMYDDYAEYILRMTEDGEENLICAYPVEHYNKTSGTMGNPKRIPFSSESERLYKRYGSQYMRELTARVVPGDKWKVPRTIMMMESSEELARLRNGATYGAVSERSLIASWPQAEAYFTSPHEAMFPAPHTNTRYLHARFALMDPNVTDMGGTFFSFMAELMRYIENNWQMLVHDIENGTIDPSVSIPDAVRASVLKKIAPLPERAAELREVFSEGFSEPFVPKIWPRFSYITGTGTGTYTVFADRLRHYTGDEIRQLKFGIAASEGIYSVCYAPNTNESVLLPDAIFYEFLPLDAGDDFSRIVTLDAVEPGADYELIITNASGFYRYRTRDAVRVHGRYRNTPTIDFLYRIDRTISIMGEKTTEIALHHAATATAAELGFDLVGFSLYPDMTTSPVCYRFYMEIADCPPDIRPKEIRHVLEEELARANPSMGDKVRRGICGGTIINFVEPETYMLYRDLMVARGTAAGQVKPLTVIANDMQRRFFNAMTEYSVEKYV